MKLEFLITVLAISFWTPTPSYAVNPSLCRAVFRAPLAQDLAAQWLQPMAQEDQGGAQFFWNWLRRRSENKLLRKIDPFQMDQQKFTQWWVDEFLEIRFKQLKSDSTISPSLREILISKDIGKLVVRSVLNQGLKQALEKSSESGEVGIRDRLLHAARTIRLHPIFQALVVFKVSKTKILLNEEQIQRVLDNGLGAFDADPDLNFLRRENQKVEDFNLWTIRIQRLLWVGYVLGTTMMTFPEVQHSIEQLTLQAQQVTTQKAKQEIIAFGDKNRDNLIMSLVEDKFATVNILFQKKYGREPTTSEKKQIEESLCKETFGYANAGVCVIRLHPS